MEYLKEAFYGQICEKRSSIVKYATGLVPARGFECHGTGGGFVYFGEVERVGVGGGVGGTLLAISA